MRFFLLILLLANVVLFAYSGNGGQQNVLPPPLNEDRLIVLKPGDQAQDYAAASLDEGCLEWGPFKAALEDTVRTSLASHRIAYREERRIVDVNTWMVMIGYFPRLKEAEQLSTRLLNEGISDVAVVSAGNGQMMVSLGVYKSEATAQERRRAMEARHIENLQVIPRGKDALFLVFNRLSPNETQQLHTLATPFVGIPLQPVSCR